MVAAQHGTRPGHAGERTAIAPSRRPEPAPSAAAPDRPAALNGHAARHHMPRRAEIPGAAMRIARRPLPAALPLPPRAGPGRRKGAAVPA